MKKIRVLIVDDSVVYRTQIKAALSSLPSVEVVGSAPNGKIALEKLAITPVDLVLLDLEMPEMNGIQTLKEMNSRNIKCKTFVFSSASKRGAEITFEALRLGAYDFIAKPGHSEIEKKTDHSPQPFELIKAVLEPKILSAFLEFEQADETSIPLTKTKPEFRNVNWDLFVPDILVIAASTGGPTVLEKIFAKISGPTNCPILITQHMPPIFTASLAERIEKLCGIRTKEGEHGEVLKKSTIYIAPGNFHMTLTGTQARSMISLDQGPLVQSVRPAADPLFQSAARIYGDKCLAVVLTGMGADGEYGSRMIKEAGGAVLIQNRESCVVFGMPGAVQAAGAYDRALDPDEIAGAMNEKINLISNFSSEANRGE